MSDTNIKIKKGGKIKCKKTNELKNDTKLLNLLRNAVEASSDDSGWAHLASVGSNIAKQAPEFDPRNYGYKKLGELASATKLFQLRSSKAVINEGEIISVPSQVFCP